MSRSKYITPQESLNKEGGPGARSGEGEGNAVGIAASIEWSGQGNWRRLQDPRGHRTLPPLF